MPQSLLMSSIGPIRVDAASGCLTAIGIGGSKTVEPEDAVTREASAQLAAWFAGRLARFDLPLAPARSARGTLLREAIIAVEHGQTASYGDVSYLIGSSPRAVGQACARNPFPIIVPCHRILGSGGNIGHYSAGDGISTKRRLLAFEQGRMFSDG